MELACVAQTYDWGKLGSSSLVAKLLKSNKNFRVEENLPYAELWIGTHALGESTLLATGETLYNFISRNPMAMGTGVSLAKGDLPFMLKILSVDKPLSVQVHPDRDLAVLLHRRYPMRYRSGNHKPKLIVAVSEFEALVGFRPLSEIHRFISMIPELELVLLSGATINFLRSSTVDGAKQLFSNLMNASTLELKESFRELMARLNETVDLVRDDHLYKLLKKLSDEYPGDVGVFCIYFLNYLKIKPGEAVFIKSGVPYCYLKGDCVECAGSSDDVVRLGLTAKFRDVDTIGGMLDFSNLGPTYLYCKGKHIDSRTVIYKPPIKEFAVSKITVPPSEKLVLSAHHGCSLFIIIEGTGICSDFEVRTGAVLFIPAHSKVVIIVGTHLSAFRAYCNV